MAWSDEDRAKLREAVASGILTVSYAGPPARTITYQDLDKMRALLASMDAEAARVAGTAPTSRRAAFRRGFRDE